MEKKKVAIFWFRRDLRLRDNTGLYQALKGKLPVVPLFIFDSNILDNLKNRKDKRVKFIHQQIVKIQKELNQLGSSLLAEYGEPEHIWNSLLKSWDIRAVYANRDYEPYARQRDEKIEKLLKKHTIPFITFKDQVIFEQDEIIKGDGNPYSVFTPFKNKWLDTLGEMHLAQFNTGQQVTCFFRFRTPKIPSLKDLDFVDESFTFPAKTPDPELIKNYHKTRDFPAIKGTTRLGIHLRFGTISIRELVRIARQLNNTFLNELIWREFFMMILYYHPRVVQEPFHPAYQHIRWFNDEDQFQRWCAGQTGYPLVDAGMRELNETGHMHNRVRMITSSFLAKHLLIDWRWGEEYFAEKLLDFELSANNGNWQWAAGCGCDAAPYFRIFNPESQMKKFDPGKHYIKRWIPEFGTTDYPKKMVDHKIARDRALEIYRQAIRR